RPARASRSLCGLGAPPDLPSFPTRRSSDLSPFQLLPILRCGVIAREWKGLPPFGNHWCDPHTRGGQLSCDSLCRRTARWSRRPRSEEHTSELQSRENLVCRLLREKKKHQHA